MVALRWDTSEPSPRLLTRNSVVVWRSTYGGGALEVSSTKTIQGTIIRDHLGLVSDCLLRWSLKISYIHHRLSVNSSSKLRFTAL